VAIVANRGSIDQTQASLALAYMIQLTGLLQWCVRQSAELENQLTSVERVLEYRTLEPESKWVSCGDEVQLCPHHDTYDSAGWPVHGDIDFGSVTMRYDHDLEPVLTDVTFSIKHGQKIGVVGRSGSGKSSLIAALFRMAPTTGLIKIDGIPICTVPLELLRRSLCVIPQKPILFEGTLRSNLDPLNTSTAVAVYSALKNVGLDVSVRLMGGLATTVKDSGSNFSVGERQLLCLARAIINKTHIIVMDEATANIDTETDATIQAVLKQCFADATVIVVAHRLDTILDSNSILVLDKGHLIEQGSPDKLLGNPGSALSQMLPMSHKRKSSATETGPQRPHTAVHTSRSTPRLVPLSKQQPKYLGKMHF
jgi:ATP-binding cassette subfamily C (CFTR/MRP) protein 4